MFICYWYTPQKWKMFSEESKTLRKVNEKKKKNYDSQINSIWCGQINAFIKISNEKKKIIIVQRI